MLTIKRVDIDEAQLLIEGAAAKAREIVSEIGVSSGTAEQNLVCAEAAIQYFYAASGRKA